MLPSETLAVVGSYYKWKNIEFRNEWEKTRWLGTHVYNSAWGRKKKTPKTLMPFPWERGGITSKEEIEELRKDMGWQRPGQH